MILERLEVGPYASNCYIVGAESSKEGMIIDPGAESRRILKVVEDLGLNIKIIVVTHAHIDHIGALEKVKAGTGAISALHEEDVRLFGERAANIISGPSLNIDRKLKGGDSIDIGDLHFLVIHTPGHSPGGICLLGHGVLFSGDTLFNYGIGRYDLPGGDYDKLMDGIFTKLMVLPENTVVYPGHGPETTIGDEKKGNPFLRG